MFSLRSYYREVKNNYIFQLFMNIFFLKFRWKTDKFVKNLETEMGNSHIF